MDFEHFSWMALSSAHVAKSLKARAEQKFERKLEIEIETAAGVAKTPAGR